MTKWEYYHAFYGLQGDSSGMKRWSMPDVRTNATHTEALNYLGQQGWELVQIADYSNGTAFYFKRPFGV